MKKYFLLCTFAVILLNSCGQGGSKADNDFDVSVTHSKLTSSKPRVCFDESHKEHHQIEAE